VSYRPVGLAVKRGLDVVAAVIGLIVLAPATVAVALVVRWRLGSPVLFRQTRPGLGGDPFELLKFRTMKPPSSPLGENNYEQRLTSLGRWLRRTSLDEIPQLINVLRGDISLVGPRPLLVEYLPLYSPEQARRHDVRPGLTGLAQINGRSCLEMTQRFACDVWYVDHWSLWLDLRILVRTMSYVLSGSGVGHGAAPQPAWTGNDGASSAAGELPASLLGRTRSGRRALRVLWSVNAPLYDAGAWAAALYLATWCRYDWHLELINEHRLVPFVLVAIVTQWTLGLLLRTYRGRYFTGSVEQAWNLALVAFAVGAILMVTQLASSMFFAPRAVPLIAPFIMCVLAAGARLGLRAVQERPTPLTDHSAPRRVIVFGAGSAGRQLVRAMLTEGQYLPVALLDDAAELRHRCISGVRVRGSRHDLAIVAADTAATVLIIAVPSAAAALTNDLAQHAVAAGLEVKQLPSVSQLLSSRIGLADLRDVDTSALLGRSQVHTDVEAVASYLSGKRVLVTGAGGSIGSELCRQISRFAPAELMMLDRDESALHAVQLSLNGTALLDSRDIILADIRDRDVVLDLFQDRRPEVVFHAAALKHLPVLERYPVEAWKTNVLGTANVVDAALAAGVWRFVNVSTDKAANPTSTLGRSKRVGERLVAAVGTDGLLVSGGHSLAGSSGACPDRGVDGSRYLSVRFGNVLGSRGSVLTTFTEQIAAGLPVTVTHPEVTRYFMTIAEAVQLVIQAGAIGERGEVLVLDMGAPVRIVDMVTSLMQIAGKWSSIVYTGLRHGEKLHEELFGNGEHDERPVHPAIAHVPVPPLRRTEMAELFAAADPVSALRRLSGGLHAIDPAILGHLDLEEAAAGDCADSVAAGVGTSAVTAPGAESTPHVLVPLDSGQFSASARRWERV
jgi:FlaA1/EpsC-like NDP-sugar epimerase/lipopolysaccharide/colanic/teichoic acid biosynthesis glycosyltransferase